MDPYQRDGEFLPFGIIDFEASSLDENGFPIEVAIVVALGHSFKSISRLIRPAPGWMRPEAWSKRSQRVHGISPDELENSPSAAYVLDELSRFCRGHPAICSVYSDNAEYDSRWLEKLAAAAGTIPPVRVIDITALLRSRGIDPACYAKELAAMPVWHRAQGDADRLAYAVLAAGRPE